MSSFCTHLRSNCSSSAYIHADSSTKGCGLLSQKERKIRKVQNECHFAFVYAIDNGFFNFFFSVFCRKIITRQWQYAECKHDELQSRTNCLDFIAQSPLITIGVHNSLNYHRSNCSYFLTLSFHNPLNLVSVKPSFHTM